MDTSSPNSAKLDTSPRVMTVGRKDALTKPDACLSIRS